MKSIYSILLVFCAIGAICTVAGNRYKKKPKGCKPQTILHGRLTATLPKGKRYFSPGQTVGVICKQGYVRTGPPTASCSAKGIWTAILQCSNRHKKLPICKMTELKMGYYRPMKKAYGPGDVITWHCNANHILKGPLLSKCTENGYFALPKPECIPTIGGGRDDGKPFVPSGPGTYNVGKHSCRLPDPPENGYIEKIKGRNGDSYYQIGREIKYGCKKGFRLQGSERSVCRRFQGFIPYPPICKRVECQFRPLKPQYGDYIDLRTEYYYGDKVEYVCDEHYTMIGVGWAICQEDGQFSSGPPECRAPTCRFDCEVVRHRKKCQCDKECVVRKDCCGDFDQHCRKLFY